MPAYSEVSSVVDQQLLLQLGGRLKQIRLRKGLTTVELAKRAGLSRMTLRSIESGEPSPTIGSYLRVMNVLGVSQDLALLASDVQRAPANSRIEPEVSRKVTKTGRDPRHGPSDLQSLVLHQEAVKLIKEKPELIERALNTLDRWKVGGTSRSKELWDEWVVILRKRDWRRALAHTNRSQQLRQASPLPTLLRDEGRLEIIRAVARLRKDEELSAPVVPVLSPPSRSRR